MSTTFVVEAVKFVLSFTFYVLQPLEKRSHRDLGWRDVLPFSVPAFVYFVNNNLIFVILMYVTSTMYQILSALKTVATGVLFRLVLKRILSNVQYASILLLACGAATSQFPICPVCATDAEVSSGAGVALPPCTRPAVGPSAFAHRC